MNTRQLASSSFTTHQRIVSALTEHDRRMSTRRGYNRYALGLYMVAVGRLDEALAAGTDLRRAILDNFCGLIADKLLRATGLPLQTRDELRT